MAQSNIPSIPLPDNSGKPESSPDSLSLQLIEAQQRIDNLKERIYAAIDELATWTARLRLLQEQATWGELIAGLDMDGLGEAL